MEKFQFLKEIFDKRFKKVYWMNLRYVGIPSGITNSSGPPFIDLFECKHKNNW